MFEKEAEEYVETKGKKHFRKFYDKGLSMADLLKECCVEFTTETTKELQEENNRLKRYAKLLQDICSVMGNDPYMVNAQLVKVVTRLWDTSEEKEGLKMCDNILDRLLEIKPQEWAEIEKWEEK